MDGLGTIVWDGVDSVDNQISMGLNGLDLTTSGANTGIMLRFGADLHGDSNVADVRKHRYEFLASIRERPNDLRGDSDSQFRSFLQ